MSKPVTAFQSEDGTLHFSQLEADLHDTTKRRLVHVKSLKARLMLMAGHGLTASVAEVVADAIIKNWDEINGIINPTPQPTFKFEDA